MIPSMIEAMLFILLAAYVALTIAAIVVYCRMIKGDGG